MLQQHMFKLIVKMFGSLLQNQTRFAILFLSLVLTACGGTSEKTTPLEEPGIDGIAPSLTGTAKTARGERDVFAKARNYCNLSQKVAIDQTVLVEIDASESVLPPNVTIGGMPVTMTGAHYSWLGEFELNQLDLQGYVHNQEIPYEISVKDSSGMVSDLYTPSPNSDESLLFCDPAEDENACACYPKDISGDWQLRQKPRAMGVGQAEGETGDWSSSDFHLSQRACLFDDIYTFTADPGDATKRTGSFEQEMGDSTWLEPWQSKDVERCGEPQAPFDGSTPDMTYIWDTEAETLTLEGLGAHIALPRVANDEENTGTPVDKVVYKLEQANACLITLNIQSGGPSPWWHFEIERVDCETSDTDSGLLDGANAAPPIFSTQYDGMPALDIKLTMTDIVNSDEAGDSNPSLTDNDTTFNVPSIFIDEDNPDVYAYFSHDPESQELYEYLGSDSGQAYLDAVAASEAADTALDIARSTLNDAVAQNAAADQALNEAIAAYDNDPSSENQTAVDNAQLAKDNASNLATQAFDDLTQADEEQKIAAQAVRDAIYYSNVLTFGSGGYIYFKGSVPDDVNVNLYFKIDHYAVDPASGGFGDLIDSFDTKPVEIKGNELGFYGAEIDATLKQGNSVSLVIETPDTDVVVRDIRVMTTNALDDMTRGPYYFNNIFSGGPLGLDPDTGEIDDELFLGTDGNPLNADNALPDIQITNEGTTFLVPPFYFEDPDTDGVVDNPGAYSGIGLDPEGIIDLTGRPLTFGDGGKITFDASVVSGTADIRFRLERIASEVALETEPSCTMPAVTVTGATLTNYEINIPVQADREFQHVVMYIDTPDAEVTVTNVMMETSQANADNIILIDCGSDAVLYGDKILDMTAPYGDATIDSATDDQGNPVALFRVDTEVGNGYAGYAVNNGSDPSPLIATPAAFGNGGRITFTASIPALQQITDAEGEIINLPNPQSEVDIRFILERESSNTPDSCKTEPSYTTEVITVSGAEMEYSIIIPIPTPNEYGEGGSFNIYQSFIMELLTTDTQVQIGNITLTTTPPSLDGKYERPDRCFATPLPSQYFDSPITANDFDGDGINDDVDPDIDNDGTPNEQEDDPATDDIETDDDYNYTLTSGKAAVFTGTYGNMGAAAPADTVQNGDQYTFPANSAHYGGWSNDNGGLNPLKFGNRTPPFNPAGPGPARIAFCAFAPVPGDDETDTGDVSVTFKFENNPYPKNSQQVLTDAVAVPRDGVKRPYMAFLTDTKNIAVYSFTHSDGTVTDPEFPKEAYPELESPATVILTREFTSLQMYIDKRDVAVTIGKIMGNWDNGTDQSFFSKSLNLNATQLEDSNYCADFPDPDMDLDGIKDNRDLYPSDPLMASDIDTDADGTDDLLDNDIDGDGVINEEDSTPYGN